MPTHKANAVPEAEIVCKKIARTYLAQTLNMYLPQIILRAQHTGTGVFMQRPLQAQELAEPRVREHS